jgi:hypothetical protein
MKPKLAHPDAALVFLGRRTYEKTYLRKDVPTKRRTYEKTYLRKDVPTNLSIYEFECVQ